MRSMTGYGQARRSNGSARIAAVVRSVNHRFLNLEVRLESDWSAMMPEVQRLVRRYVGRGSVEVEVRRGGGSAAASSRIDGEILERYVGQARRVARSMKLAPPRDIGPFLLLPGVVTEKRESSPAPPRREILEVLEDALGRMDSMRCREGRATAKELRSILGRVETLVAGIGRRAATNPGNTLTRLRRRLDVLLGDGSRIAPADLAREAALLADRLDLSEEAQRLQAHAAAFRVVLRDEERCGRKLDYLTQEMNREANTMTAKGGDARIHLLGVDLKTQIERLREQVQNLE